MADFDTIRDLKQTLIRKALKGAVLIGDETATIPAAFTQDDGSGGITMVDLTGFQSVGHISAEASPTFTPEVETSEVESWGLLEPSRTDIISRSTSITWTSQETNKLNLAMYANVDLDNVTPDATTGEVHVVDPTDPAIIYRRAIFLFVDGAGDDAIYVFKVCPRLVITEVAEQTWGNENAVSYAFTARAKVDSTLGYAIKTVYGGPGWDAATAGFNSAPAGTTLSSITATPSSMNLAVGATDQITVSGNDSNDYTASSTYASDDVGVATVTTGGEVQGVAAGTATITVTYSGFTDTVAVQVA